MFRQKASLICALSSVMLLVAGCNTPTQTAAPAAGETTQVSTAAPADTPTEPATSAVAATETPATLPEATVTLSPSSTPAPTNPSPTATGVVTYQSTALGISFRYLTSDNGEKFAIKETGDRIYVYMANVAPETGQWVKVYSKPIRTSLVDAVRSQVLKGYSTRDCIVKQAADPNVINGAKPVPGWSFATIDVPRSADDDMDTLMAKVKKCPQTYLNVNGLAYFMTDANHPDRFLFFSIGQYYIPAGPNQPWQTTVQFITPSSSTGNPVTLPANQYLDDRSNPERVISSLVNALNRKEYARAYSYWQSTDKLQPFDQYVQGYANTESVQVKTGTVRGSAGAGNVYYTIPAILSANTSGGTTQTFAACYMMHLANPDMQAAPGFTPLGIQSAHIEQVGNDIDATAMLDQICAKSGYPQDPPIPAETGDQAYTDDRSGPVQVLRSLFNAVNSRQYGRAYSYWEPESEVAPFDQFQQGYADTAAVSVTTGSVGSNAGAGQVYFNVPATLVAKTNNGTTQTFVGCYSFHLANPGIQGPPFQPLSIISATVKKVANGSDTVSMMKTACPPL